MDQSLTVSLKQSFRKGKYYEIDITDLSHEGRGVGKRNGKTVFVHGALPGERVIARTLKKRSKFEEAEAVQVLKKSDMRIEARCAHFGICGGCSLQHMGEKDQLSHKQSVLLELLQHQARIAPAIIADPITSAQWGYRKKARLGVKWVQKKNGIVVGFREKSKGFITDSTDCEVLDPRVGKKIVQLRMLLQGLSIADRIPQLEVAITRDIVSIVVRHLAPIDSEDVSVLKRFGRKHQINFYLQSDGLDTISGVEDGFANMSYDLDGVLVQFRPTDFTQINSDVNTAMVRRVLAYLSPQKSDEILDLYCGIGNFSLSMAALGARVVGFENDERMVCRAEMNANFNKFSNCSFLSVDLDDPYDLESINVYGANKMLLDPPRSGASTVFKHLKLDAIERLVYVSCNPITFARDAGILFERQAFKLKEVGILDMFPQTSHFECIGFFTR